MNGYFIALRRASLIIFLSLVVSTILMPLLAKADYQDTRPDKSPRNPIIIPIDLDDGRWIFLKGQCGYKIITFRLDTGSYVTILPASLDLVDVKRKIKNLEIDIYQDVLKKAFMGVSCVLPELSIGDLVVKHISSVATFKTSPRPQKGLFTTTPLLSNAVFAQQKIVLDFEQHMLEIRSPDEKKDKEGVLSDALTLRFDYATAGDKACGVPVIQGHLYGRKVRILVDTGVGSDEVSISPGLFDAIKGQAKATISQTLVTSAANGQEYPVTRLDSIMFDIGGKNGYRFQVPAEVLPGQDEYDMAIGMSILRHFRVTINYPDREITFSPYVTVPREAIVANKGKRLFANFFAASPPTSPPHIPTPGYFWRWETAYGWIELPLPTSSTTTAEHSIQRR